jgi:hypothetical protein
MTYVIGATMWMVGAAMAYRVTAHMHRAQTVRRRLYG